MSATLVLIQLIGGVVLLLWGMRMVRTGVERAYGTNLRQFLGKLIGNRLSAFLAGIGVTSLLQSSTATCLVTASFASRNFITGSVALAVMLGADLGTSLVAQILSLDITFLAPMLLLAGYIIFQSSERWRPRGIGRVIIGLGLMLLALKWISENTLAMEGSPTVLLVLNALAGDLVLAVVIAAVLTVVAHSSLAIILMVSSLVATESMQPVLAVALVLGANLGGGIPAILATLRSTPSARRVATGNAIFKLVGVILALPFAAILADFAISQGISETRLVVNTHTAFNLALAVSFLPLTGLVEMALKRVLPDKLAQRSEDQPLYLEHTALREPQQALANAARETLRIGDKLLVMLNGTITVFRTDDRDLAQEVSKMDDSVDKLFEAVKLYLTELRRASLDAEESKRSGDIMLFATNLEHIGDIIDKNLLELAEKKAKYQLHFSEEGFEDIEQLYERVRKNLQLAMSVFISGERNLARKLLEEKENFRDLERRAAEDHYGRLQTGRRESIETSSLHLDILRDLRRLNSHACSAAYSILEEAGELRPSRLKEVG